MEDGEEVGCWELQTSECPLEELFGEFHMLYDIRLEVARAGLPVVGGITHAAGEEDEFVGIDRWENTIFGIAADHAKTVDEHPDEEIGLAESVAVLFRHKTTIDESRQRLHGVGGAQDRPPMTVHDLEVLDRIFDIDNTSGAMFEVDRASLHELLQLLPA